MAFAEEKQIKAVRKARRCDGCNAMVEVGSPATTWAGKTDGDFSYATFHVDCRAAEIALNKIAGTCWDEWMGLGDMEVDDWPWLLDSFPAVAARMGITQARHDEILAERARISAARRAIETGHPQ